jgi:hypothetical protein
LHLSLFLLLEALSTSPTYFGRVLLNLVVVFGILRTGPGFALSWLACELGMVWDVVLMEPGMCLHVTPSICIVNEIYT